eukprot:TRINITY_DN47220_c0_g1_i1.p2 TRINITY_DN47220_c0_g1~~TRINITY_DN47220_c0_g1_i1.p2  ORF type:complete len:358 (+),score=114.98 TRINITY_DN47220_c0_g1_i1:83-1075(+)
MAGRRLPGPRPTAPWRLSASVVVAAHSADVPPSPQKFRLPQTSCDYRICMVRRNAKASFMPDALVFPGGAVDSADAAVAAELLAGGGGPDAAIRLAAVRETFEESGVLLAQPSPQLSEAESAEWRRRVGRKAAELKAFCQKFHCTPCTERLHYWCSFVTPDFEAARVKKGGFDARFYLCVAASGELRHHASDKAETTELLWLTPEEAVAACHNGTVYMAPPQFVILNELCGHTAIAGLAAAAAAPSRRIQRDYPTKPEVAVSAAKTALLVLPGDEIHSVWPGGTGARNRIHWSGKVGARPDYRHEVSLPAGIDLGDTSRDVYAGVGLSKL